MKTIIIVLHIVTATLYHAVEGQTDDTPNITATGFTINMEDPASHRIIAVSRDLEKIGFTMGTEVCIENAGLMTGVWIIRDRMNKRWTNRIDFLVDVEMKAGKWEGVTIKINTKH
jgi:3D (Asp-Asp-Asp) domain-containing protein